MVDYSHYFEVNKDTWDKKTKVHANSAFYDMLSFRSGKTSLNAYEIKALGDVKGKSLLHLQCHFGQDTLSLSRAGAQCTGVDISEESISLARKLNTELKLDAQFVCCNVLNIPQNLDTKYDIVFTSYGVLGWLPDLEPWAKMIAKMLKPNGVFYMVEFHPIVWMFDYQKKIPQLHYSYHQKEVIYEEYTGTYADESSSVISKEYTWNHGLGEIITSLAQAGLQIDFLNEHDKSPYCVFPGLIQTDDKMYAYQDALYPLVFEIKATKI